MTNIKKCSEITLSEAICLIGNIDDLLNSDYAHVELNEVEDLKKIICTIQKKLYKEYDKREEILIKNINLNKIKL
jgi:hypothetical protein